MGIMVCSLLWVMQDFVHQPYDEPPPPINSNMEPGSNAR